MRKFSLVLALMTLIAIPAFAQNVDRDSSWDDILASPQLRAAFPAISFGNTFVPVNALCVDGASLRTVDPIEVCLDWDMGHMRCNRGEERTLSAAIDHLERVCVKRRRMMCIETKVISVSTPLDYKITVYKKVRYPTRVAFRKEFTIPGCE